MKNFIKIFIPILILGGTVLAIYYIMTTPPKAKKLDLNKITKIPIEIQKIEKKEYAITLTSYGVAQASTQTTLTSQVSGKIIYVNDNLKNGGYFKKGELLLQIEPDDYQADVKIAQAELILAQQALIEEEAKVTQAKEDWKKFNLNEKPNSLVLRQPQLQSAKANLLAAQASLKKAQLNLKRTKVYAPYTGRVIEKNISIAQVISSNTQIATIFSNDAIEVRLPIKTKELGLINTKEHTKVTLFSKISNQYYDATIVRSESSIDTNTKQLYLIAQLQHNEHIKIGEYLTAKIEAKQLKDVIIIPNSSIYQSSYVYIEKEGKIQRKNIQIDWQDDENSLISSGIAKNEHLVITTLGLVSSGTKVTVVNTPQEIK